MEDKPSQPHESTCDRRQPLDGEEEDDLEKLEEEIKEMVQKVAHYRSTFPGQLKNITARILAAQRRELPLPYADGSGPGPSRDPGAASHADDSERDMTAQGVSAAEGLSTSEDLETADKLRLLRDKMHRNVSAMPTVLKRLNECICRIDKLDSSDEIHPAFKRKKS